MWGLVEIFFYCKKRFVDICKISTVRYVMTESRLNIKLHINRKMYTDIVCTFLCGKKSNFNFQNRGFFGKKN